jgi:probable rRNA maturation factor
MAASPAQIAGPAAVPATLITEVNLDFVILNRQRRVRVPISSLERFLELACKRLRVPAHAIAVCLVTDSEMARWNFAYRGKNGPTDVLSFSTDGPALNQRKRKTHSRRTNGSSSRSAFSVSSHLGDIAIAPAVARSNAQKFGRSFDDEMRILILHGMLHLMGYDHESDEGQMDRRERQLRRELGLA